MKIHKAVLGYISQDSRCVCVCNPVSSLGDCIQLRHFDNLLFLICCILSCMCQREMATCPFDAWMVG